MPLPNDHRPDTRSPPSTRVALPIGAIWPAMTSAVVSEDLIHGIVREIRAGESVARRADGEIPRRGCIDLRQRVDDRDALHEIGAGCRPIPRATRA